MICKYSACSSLTSVTIPSSVTKIGKGAFYGCSLKKVELPNSVKTIGSNAFANCTKIEYVSCSSATPPVCSGNIFPNDVYLNVSLIVPKGKTDLYKSSNGWNNFLSITEGEDATQPEQCSAPYISLKEGKIHLNSTTPGATYHYTITSLDSNNDKKVSKDGIIPLSGKYIIKAYATADNYITSDITETTIQLPIDTVFSTITEYVERQENPYKKITIRQGDLGSISYHVESQKKYIYQILAEPELSIHSVTYNGVDVTNNLIENSFEAPNLIEDSELVIAYESICSSISSTSQNKIRVNGFNQKVYISNLNKTDFVQVYDISGKLIESKYPNESDMIISTGNGIFLVKVNETVIKISL